MIAAGLAVRPFPVEKFHEGFLGGDAGEKLPLSAGEGGFIPPDPGSPKA
jgi:hypothetical protein